MMDQQNFEAPRPVSADPAVALEKRWTMAQGACGRAHPVAKTSVEALAQELGLKLGDQNELTIRRIKRGKGYSFVRANGTAIRHAGTIQRLNSMAVPPAYAEVRYSPDPTSHLQAVGRDAAAGCNTAITPIGRRFASIARRTGWQSWSRRCRKSAATSRCTCPAMRRPANSRCRQ